jgi:tetratricopeptide (TPR) repeat protein
VLVGGQKLEVIDTETGDCVAVLVEGDDLGWIAVAFTPDSRWLVTGDPEGVARLWDTRTWNRVAQYRIPVPDPDRGAPPSLPTPDGRWILTSNGDGTSRLWPADPLAEAERLKPRELAPDERERLQIGTEEDRAAARRAWRERWLGVLNRKDPLVREAYRTAWELHEELGTWWEAAERMESDATLDPELGRLALWQARRRCELPSHLKRLAWTVAKSPGRERPEYAKALHRAELAHRLAPHDPETLQALGVAQYRIGDLEAAVETLVRSNEQNEGEHPVDVAFLAMAHHRLGQAETARGHLDRLRGLMGDPDCAGDSEWQAFLREAEELVRAGD